MIRRYYANIGDDAGASTFTAVSLALTNDEGIICSAPESVYYISGIYTNIAPGAVIYSNPQLTNPVIGFSYARNALGVIYAVASSTGTVMSPTGNSC